MSVELSVVVPTLNEVENVVLLARSLESALQGIRWEVIFVDDDSTDGTVAAVRRLAQDDLRVRCLKRIGRRGLAGACIEGVLSSSAFAVAVIDADLQHDPTRLPLMLQMIKDGADLVVGTRYSLDGSAQQGFSTGRQWASRLATQIARRVARVNLTDPMSGFFMVRRDVFEMIAPKLSAQGFKLLFDMVLSSAGSFSFREIPYRFMPRRQGVSKFGGFAVMDFFDLLLAKISGNVISFRFVLFALVETSGLVLHLSALRVVLHVFNPAFDVAQMAATFAAMTWNFLLNNELTYRDLRLRGIDAFRGLLSFYIICSVGAVANIGIANWLYGMGPVWWLAGFAGASMSLIFNYLVSSRITWRHF